MTPLVEELIPCPDPWDVARKLSHLPHLLFLDSAEQHAERGRYSYVMADPFDFKQFDLETYHYQFHEDVGFVHPRTMTHNSPMYMMDWFEAETQGHLPPFQGGFAGLINYDMNREIECVPLSRHRDFHFPEITFGVYTTVVAFDHQENRAWCITQLCRPEVNLELHELSRSRHHLILTALKDHSVDQVPCVSKSFRFVHDPLEEILRVKQHGMTSNFSREDYLAAVRKCIDYIHAGDIFQVNLSQRLLAPLTEHPLELYGRLRRVSPAPFACYFDAGEFQIASASPERFLQVTANREIITQPIKGTRPRGRTPAEDAALIADLLANPKDRSENVMIVDLLRNDIGKVAEYGSVHVPRVCELETYPYVHHLVSEVRGRLRADKTPFDLLKAAFPGGSVTGAPKVRAMEIIAELEPTARGPYCGSIGFIGFDGVMDTNILIRTLTAGRGWLQFPVGGGIVADSSPEAEYQETLDKAAGLLKALKNS